MFSLESRVIRNDAVLFTAVDGEIVTMNIASGNYYNFDKIGSFVWDMIENESSIEDICSALHQIYNAPLEIIQRDIIALLEDMKRHNLLKPSAD